MSMSPDDGALPAPRTPNPSPANASAPPAVIAPSATPSPEGVGAGHVPPAAGDDPTSPSASSASSALALSSASATPSPRRERGPGGEAKPSPFARFGLKLAYWWWKVFAAIFLFNYVPGGVIALVQGGWPGLVSYATSWGLLRPVEALNPPVFWAAAAALALLALLGLVVERREKAAEPAVRHADSRRAATEVLQEYVAAGVIAVRELPEPPFDLTALPAPPEFVGRVADLEWLLRRLRAGGTTGITALRGLGGIGKTALAAVAARVLYKEGRFVDGIVAISCLNITDPAAVLLRVLAALGATPSDGATDQPALARALYQRLHGKDVLIVLDNIEPELKPLTDVTIPLREAGATLLVTARQTLPANVLAADDTLKLDVLPPEEALLLFASTYLGAGKTAADLSPTDRTAAEDLVGTLARHTLAVQLAAAYARDAGRDLPTLARELRDDPLKVPSEDAARAVELVFRQSTDRLPVETRRLFAALACFASNEFGRRAALALAAGLETPDPDAALDLLVRRALLDAQPDAALPEGADVDRERLRLHPLLRELAAELLDDDPSTRAAAALAIAAFYARYASATPDAALVPDAENIAGALEWAHDHAPDEDRDALVAGICNGMRIFWRDRSRTRDSLRYLPWGIEASGAIATQSHNANDLRRAANIAVFYGDILMNVGRLPEAEQTYRVDLDQRRSLGDRQGEGAALSRLGQIAQRRGRLEQAEGYFQQSLAIDREVQDRQGEGVDLASLGQIAQRRGRLEEAEGYFQESLAIRRQVQDRQGEGVVLSSLGQIAQRRGRLEEAEGYFQESLAIDREVQDRRGEGVVLYHLALIREEQGDLDGAESLHRESLQISLDVQNAQDAADSLQTLARFLIEHDRGKPREGCDMLRQAIAIYHQMGVPDEEGARGLAAELGCDVGE